MELLIGGNKGELQANGGFFKNMMRFNEEHVQKRHKEEEEAKQKAEELQKQRDERGKRMREMGEESKVKVLEGGYSKEQDLKNKIRKSEIDAMPEAERIAAFTQQIQEIFATMDSLGGKAYAKNEQGLQAWAADLKIVAEVSKKEADVAAWEKVLGIILQVRDIEKERVNLHTKQFEEAAENARKSEEHRQDFAEKARTQVMDLLPDDRKRAALIEDLKRQLGGGSLGDLRKEIAKMTDAGNIEGASRLEKRYSRAIEDAKGAAALGDGQMSQRVGGAQNLINILTGKGANQLGERQVDLLKDVLGVLNEIKEKTGTSSGLGNGLEDLTF